MNEVYFLDTYAIIEILKGNVNYLKYRNCDFIITKLNLFELFYYLLQKLDFELAKVIIGDYFKHVIDYDFHTITSAAYFRSQNKKANLSMSDCIGYFVAKTNNIAFVTGDKEFKNIDNVEFVK